MIIMRQQDKLAPNSWHWPSIIQIVRIYSSIIIMPLQREIHFNQTPVYTENLAVLQDKAEITGQLSVQVRSLKTSYNIYNTCNISFIMCFIF